jgi:hypothetical protein
LDVGACEVGRGCVWEGGGDGFVWIVRDRYVNEKWGMGVYRESGCTGNGG